MILIFRESLLLLLMFNYVWQYSWKNKNNFINSCSNFFFSYHIKFSFYFVLIEENALAICYWIKDVDGLLIQPIESMVLLFLLYQPNHISIKDCFGSFPCKKNRNTGLVTSKIYNTPFVSSKHETLHRVVEH